MTDAIYEQLSAFLDGELSAAESELLLKRIERDPTLKEQLERYVLSGEALRATRVEARPSRDFSTRVALAIDREAGVNLPARAKQAAQWLKPVAGGAIAAGVAAVALVSFQVSPLVAEQESVAEARPTLASAADRRAAQSVTVIETRVAASDGVPSFTVPVASDPATAPPIRIIANSRLTNYVMAHSEYASPLSGRNVLTGLVAEEQTDEQAAESFVVEPFEAEKWAKDAEAPSPPVSATDDQMLSRGPR